MTYDNDDDDDGDDGPRTTDEMLESIMRHVDDLDDRLRKSMERSDDGSAGIRLELQQMNREMIELRATMARLQTRFDMQLSTLVIANIASGLGVAALVLGASHAF